MRHNGDGTEIFGSDGAAQPEAWVAGYETKFAMLRLLYRLHLSAAELRVALVLLDYANPVTGACYPGRARIARALASLGAPRLDSATLRKAVIVLERAGVLHAERPAPGATNTTNYCWHWTQGLEWQTARRMDEGEVAPPPGNHASRRNRRSLPVESPASSRLNHPPPPGGIASQIGIPDLKYEEDEVILVPAEPATVAEAVQAVGDRLFEMGRGSGLHAVARELRPVADELGFRGSAIHPKTITAALRGEMSEASPIIIATATRWLAAACADG